MLESSVSEHDGSEAFGLFFSRHKLDSLFEEVLDGVRSITESSSNGPSSHFFETCGEDTAIDSSSHEIFGEMDGGGASGAVVVDVVDRNSCHADFVDSSESFDFYLCPQVESP